jgi:hypothetical protein
MLTLDNGYAMYKDKINTVKSKTIGLCFEC